MPGTVMLPGVSPAGKELVDPALMQFVNDLLYMTFYSSRSTAGVISKDVMRINADLNRDGQRTGSRYLGKGTDPADVEASFRRNIALLLKPSSPYSRAGITAASVAMLLEENTSLGRVVSWKLSVKSGRQLITGLLTGSVLYSLTSSDV